jgi:hypothetical protein
MVSEVSIHDLLSPLWGAYHDGSIGQSKTSLGWEKIKRKGPG